MTETQAIHRWRITFGVSGPLIYYSVLDLGRLWERLLRRAGLPIAYTQGYHPHPRMQFAAALPVGYSSDCELVDIYLTHEVAQQDLIARIRGTSPHGLTILDVESVPIKAKLPQSTMREATYRVMLQTEQPVQAVQQAIETLLTRDTIPRERRGKRNRQVTYDLRSLVHDIRVAAADSPRYTLQMVVRSGSHGAGRPEEIIDELGLDVSRYTIHREELVWGDDEESAR